MPEAILRLSNPSRDLALLRTSYTPLQFSRTVGQLCVFESVCSKMTSCKPGRTRAYNEDLYWRIVWQREALGKKCRNVALNLGVDTATISSRSKVQINWTCTEEEPSI